MSVGGRGWTALAVQPVEHRSEELPSVFHKLFEGDLPAFDFRLIHVSGDPGYLANPLSVEDARQGENGTEGHQNGRSFPIHPQYVLILGHDTGRHARYGPNSDEEILEKWVIWLSGIVYSCNSKW